MVSKNESSEYIPILYLPRHSYDAVQSVLECYYGQLTEHPAKIQSCYGEIRHASSIDGAHLSTTRSMSQSPSSPDPWSDERKRILIELIQSEAKFREDMYNLARLLERDMEMGKLAVGIVEDLYQNTRALGHFSEGLVHTMHESDTDLVTLTSWSASMQELWVLYKQYLIAFGNAAWILLSSNNGTENLKLLISRPSFRLFDYRKFFDRLLTLSEPDSPCHTVCQMIVGSMVQICEDIDKSIPDPYRANTSALQYRSPSNKWSRWNQALGLNRFLNNCAGKRTQLDRSILATCNPTVLMQTWVLRNRVSRYADHMGILLKHFKSVRLRSKGLGLVDSSDTLVDAIEAFLDLYNLTLSAHFESYLKNLVAIGSSDTNHVNSLESIERHFNRFREAWRWRWEAIISQFTDSQAHSVMECAENDHLNCSCIKRSSTL